MAQATDPRSKAMISYWEFARKDAYTMAAWLIEDFNLAAVRHAYETMTDEQKCRYESTRGAEMQELILKPERQRAAYLRKVGKGSDAIAQGLFLAFAIIGLIRVMDVLELRDRYRYNLTPGDPNRETCAAIYGFHHELLRIPILDWPHDFFDALESDFYLDEE